MKPDSVQKIQQRLQGGNQTRPAMQQQEHAQGQGQEQEHSLIQSLSPWDRILRVRNNIAWALRKLRRPPGDINVLPTSETRPQTQSEPQDDLYLLLCIKKGGVMSLHEERLQLLKNDNELFMLLRKRYYSIRPPSQAWFTFRTLKSISLVRVSHLPSHFTCIPNSGHRTDNGIIVQNGCKPLPGHLYQ